MKTRIKIVRSSPEYGQIDISHLIDQEFDADIFSHGGAQIELNGSILVLNSDEFVKVAPDSEIDAARLFSKIAESDKIYIKAGWSSSVKEADLVEVQSRRLSIFYFVEKTKYFLGFTQKASKSARINGNSITMTGEDGNEYTLECFKLTPVSLL